jgi:hypothetical protein
MCAQPDVLEHVKCFFGFTQHPPDVVQKSAIVRLNERAERLAIPLLSPEHKRSLFRLPKVVPHAEHPPFTLTE